MPTVQRLDPTHALAYRELMLRAYTDEPDAFTSTPEERAAQPTSWWEKRVCDDDSQVLGAFRDGVLVGTAGIEYATRTKSRHKASLFGMYVAPEARGHGLGAALLDAAFAQIRARQGMRLVTLTVSDGNRPAIALYERAGFKTFGVEPLAIRVGDRFIAKVHMACEL